MIALKYIAPRFCAGVLMILLLFTFACQSMSKSSKGTGNLSNKVEEKEEEEKNNGDAIPGCPSWERRTDRSTTKLICAQPGGNICTPDRTVCLEIPPRALDQDTEITMTIAGPEFQVADKDQLYPGAQLEPNGLTFNEPVTAIVRPRGTDDLNNVSLLLASAPDQYEELDNIERNPGTGQVTGELDHFSWLYPFLVNPTPAGNPPSIRLQGGSDVGNAIFGQVGNGATGTISLRVTQSPAGLVWTNGTISSNTLVLQVNYPTAVANQVAHATLTMIDPGEYTGYGPNARQQWRFYVFNKVFQHMTSGLHISGPDGTAIYPTMANTISWAQLPAGYPSGQVSAFIQYFDQNSVLIGTSTLVLSVARP